MFLRFLLNILIFVHLHLRSFHIVTKHYTVYNIDNDHACRYKLSMIHYVNVVFYLVCNCNHMNIVCIDILIQGYILLYQLLQNYDLIYYLLFFHRLYTLANAVMYCILMLSTYYNHDLFLHQWLNLLHNNCRIVGWFYFHDRYI